MVTLKRCALLFFVIFSSLAQAQNDISTRAGISMEEGLQVHESIIRFLESRPCEFGIRTECDKPLSLKDIETLKGLFKRLDSWNQVTFKEIVPSTDHLKGLPFEIVKGNIFSIEEKVRTNKKEKYIRIVLNPNEPLSQNFLNDVRISAASTLTMYDGLFRLSHVLGKAKKIRAIMEYDIGPESRILKDTFGRGMNEKLWANTENHLDLLKRVAQFSYNANYFEQYIAHSFTASKIKDKDFAYRMKSVLFLGGMLSQTQFMNAVEKIAFALSKFFGNTVGQVQTRDGKLKALAANPSWMNSIKSKLQPLDILLEKTPFRLTDHFIPGHYGHVAIWLGNPEEILSYTVNYQGREIALLDHPLMFPHLERLSQGKLVLEALREPGVTMNTLEHFMDIDDLLILRSNHLRSNGEKVLKALEQFGKPYDFGFDVETESSIVCSELIYIVYDDHSWPVERSAGRYTISPDHVAWKTMNDAQLDLVLMYHDGKEIKANALETLRGLLEQRSGITGGPF